MKIARKLILGVVTTGFVAATLAATTYAWYKLNNAAFTEDFTFNASTAEGFLVSIDGKTYKHKLSTEDIVKAMLNKYSPTNFKLENGNITFSGKIGEEEYVDKVLSKEEVLRAYSQNIRLSPLTSVDGVTITNRSKTEVSALDGKYGELELYIKCLSDDIIEKNDGFGNTTYTPTQKFELYLDGNDYNDGHYKAPKTDVWSGIATPVNIKKDKYMRYLDNNLNIVEKYGTEEGGTPDSMVYMYTSNAFRFSVQDLGYVTTKEVEIVDEEDPSIIRTETIETTTKADLNDAHIYEISRESEFNLGSYATKYNLGKTQNFTELDRLYNADYNAMYMYYNSVKESEPLTDLLTDDHPETITDLSGNQTVTIVESGKVTKILLKFWLEGWDADCFDDIPGQIDETTGEVINSNPINVQLLFNSRKVD